MKIDFLDFSNNFFKGFFEKLTMLQVLTVMMNYEPMTLYGLVHKSITMPSFYKEISAALLKKI